MELERGRPGAGRLLRPARAGPVKDGAGGHVPRRCCATAWTSAPGRSSSIPAMPSPLTSSPIPGWESARSPARATSCSFLIPGRSRCCPGHEPRTAWVLGDEYLRDGSAAPAVVPGACCAGSAPSTPSAIWLPVIGLEVEWYLTRLTRRTARQRRERLRPAGTGAGVRGRERAATSSTWTATTTRSPRSPTRWRRR